MVGGSDVVDDGGGEEFRHAVSPIPHGALKLVADVVKVLLHALMVALAEVAQGTIIADTWQKVTFELGHLSIHADDRPVLAKGRAESAQVGPSLAGDGEGVAAAAASSRVSETKFEH